jgi:hypothetical protein
MREVFTIYDRILFRITKEVQKVLGTPLLILFNPSPSQPKENARQEEKRFLIFRLLLQSSAVQQVQL